MKKILSILLALLLIVGAMAMPAHACTPRLEAPEVPQVSQIKLKIDFGPDFWAHWFEAHPIEAPKDGWEIDTAAFFG